MRAVVGPLVANVLFVVVGIGVLSALDLIRPSFTDVIAGLGLSFLTGVATLGLVLIALLTIGVPYNAVTILVAAILVAITAATGAKFFRRRDSREGPARPTRRLRDQISAHRVLSVCIAIFAVFAIVGLVEASVTPLASWDAWAIWTRKALLLTYYERIPAAYFTDHAYLATHQDYPLLLPVLESIWFRFAGTVNTQAIHIEFWLLLIAFVWAVAYVLGRRRVPALLWAPILVLIALATGTYTQLLTAYADIPLALFVGLGVLFLGLWIAHHETAYLAMGILFLASASNTKSEGLAIAIIALAAATVAARHKHSLRQVSIACAVLVVAVLPWHLWCVVNGVPSDPDFSVSRGLHVSYLFTRADRIWPSLVALHTQLADQTTWSYVVPIGAAVALASVAVRSARRLALFYLSTAVLTLGLYVWVYWASPNNLTWYLSTSGFRVVDAVVFIALAAALHLPAELMSEAEAVKPSTPNESIHRIEPLVRR